MTLRIYHPHKRLRLETMEIFGDSHAPRPPRPPPAPPPPPCVDEGHVCDWTELSDPCLNDCATGAPLVCQVVFDSSGITGSSGSSAFYSCKPHGSGRRLFGTPNATEDDDEALAWMSHPIGNGGGRREPPPGFTPSPSPSPSPSPTPEPSRPCARDEATCTEGYADADDAQDACGKQPRFCWIEPHTTTSPNEDTYRACTCPEERPPDAETVQGEADADPEAWWNNLEVSRRKGELYARRVLPGAHGRSAAASVAVAITLAHPGKGVLVGQRATLDAMCGALGGCEQGDYWTSVHDRDDADVDEDTPDPKHLPIDDAGWALQLLSRATEPAVHAVIEGMLICLAPALCASHCDVCDEWVGLGNATAEAVLRETELRLHTSIRQQSRSVLDCVASFECLAEVAAEVAKRLGSADTLPPTVRMEKVAKANLALLEGARAEAKQNENASWQVRRPARFALLREHVAAALAHEQTPLGEDDAVAESGRRLAERPPPSAAPAHADPGDDEGGAPTRRAASWRSRTPRGRTTRTSEARTSGWCARPRTTCHDARARARDTRHPTGRHPMCPPVFSTWPAAATTRAARGACAWIAMCAMPALEPGPTHAPSGSHDPVASGVAKFAPPPLPLLCAVPPVHHQRAASTWRTWAAR